MSRPLAVSMVAFDGYPDDIALEEIARAGASHAEPAFISGTMRFSEDDFTEPRAATLKRAMSSAGLGCIAISAHMDCGIDDAAARLERRLRFAADLGAAFVITNTTGRQTREAFLKNVGLVLPVAERLGVAIAFENPGHGSDSLLTRAAGAASLLDAIDSPWATFNYDVGNLLTNSEGELRPEQDLPEALGLARHLHLKDMTRQADAWVYTALGEGELDYRAIMSAVADGPELPVCVELPFRQSRRRYAAPVRGEVPPALPRLRDAIGRSVRLVREALPA